MKPYYQDDAVTIYHADCREIMPMVGVALIATDPPYGVGIDYASYDDTLESHALLMDWLVSVSPMSAVTITPVGDRLRLPELCGIRRPTWFFVWDKGSPGTRCKIGFNDWELFPVWGWRKDLPACHDIIRVSPDPFDQAHPCAKPIKLYRAIVSRASLVEETVLDPFMGSGTTLRAAKDLGRKAIGIEIEERYCEIAARRCAQEVMDLRV